LPVMRRWHIVNMRARLLSPAAEAFRYFVLERARGMLGKPPLDFGVFSRDILLQQCGANARQQGRIVERLFEEIGRASLHRLDSERNCWGALRS